MKAAIVVGTRPEIIKLTPIIKEYQKRELPFILIHSNQHYSANMDKIFFENLDLPQPDYNLEVGSGSHGAQTAKILERIEEILVDEAIDVVYVQGDTNTVLAAALAASKLRIRVAHVEAGLRSYDRDMPEETNRIITDNVSDYLFAVSDLQRDILLNEGICKSKISVVGNTVVDTLYYGLKLIDQGKNVNDFDVAEKEYFLITAHRPSNVDSREALAELVDTIDSAAREFSKKAVWPIHPRAKFNLDKFNITLPDSITLLDPIGYLDFLSLMKNSNAILTDSGGLQEEACILQIPCITLRENTERPESVEVGANILCGRNKERVIAALNLFNESGHKWSNPFGDGNASKKILDVVHS